MTIAVALKVRDGVVLASDSATTLADGPNVLNIYNHANKIVNLCKGKPIGFMTWGLGSFGDASIATLAKDFRTEHWNEHFATGYDVREVAEAMKDFLKPLSTAALNALPPESRSFGFLVAGQAPNQTLGEAFVAQVDPVTGTWKDLEEVSPGDVGLVWYGQPRWIQRLVLGFDAEGLAMSLHHDFGVPEADLDNAIGAIRNRTEAPFVHPGMPIQDAINLARFLVDTTKSATEFTPGALTVGGPTEIAAITKHEGFKWVSRKHYYDAEFNPPLDHA